MKILIVGGYGTFGGRLVDLLLDRPDLELHVAGRDMGKAAQFCQARRGEAKLFACVMDRAAPDAALENAKPDIVVDASGPFQVYGDKPYVLAEACVRNGCHYLDLADGADFVAGISRLNEEAKAKGLYVLSGVSSVPVLSAAVVRHLARDMEKVREIEVGIAPSPQARVGLNVVKAIASYAGKPVKLLIDGAWTTRAGFFDSKRFVINVPGVMPLKPIRFGLADVPDLQVLHWMRPEVQSVWAGAGPTPAILHRMLWAAAGLVKLKLLPSLLPFATLMNAVINVVRWGEHRGGMIVRVRGDERGRDVTRSWHLLAEGDGGPNIPSMGVAAIIVRQLQGVRPQPGARSAHTELEIDHYLPWFSRFGFFTGTRCEGEGDTLYEEVMVDAIHRLSPPLRAFHQRRESFAMRGEAEVKGATNIVGVVIRKLFGFPATGRNVLLKVNIDVKDGVEIWWRNFSGKRFQSRQWLGQGRYEGLLMESFGPLNFGMAIVEKDGELHLVQRRWDIFGLPLPKFLMPRATAFEHGKNGRFHFDVQIGLPLIGRITHYRGWLEKSD